MKKGYFCFSIYSKHWIKQLDSKIFSKPTFKQMEYRIHWIERQGITQESKKKKMRYEWTVVLDYTFSVFRLLLALF